MTHIDGIWMSYSVFTTTKGGEIYVTSVVSKSTAVKTKATNAGLPGDLFKENSVPTTVTAKASQTGNAQEKAKATSTVIQSSAVTGPGRRERNSLELDSDQPPLPRHSFVLRQLTPTGQGTNVSTYCLYYNGSELPLQ